MSAYMVDDITIVKSSGHDVWKEPTASSDVAVKGKLEYKTRLVKDMEGEEVVSSATILFHKSVDVELGRELTHEDMLKFDGKKHTILAIETPKAFSSFFVFKYKVYVA